MKKLIIVILFFFSALPVSPQNGNSGLKADGQIESGLPTVYLKYVCQDNKKVLLRMYNNTVWPIAVSADDLYYRTNKVVKLANGKEFYAMPNDKIVSLQYEVDRFALPSKNVKVPTIYRSDSSWTNWIASNDSILFSVPIEYLEEDLMVFVKLNYEWEVSKKGVIVSGPEHRVLFRGIDIPEKQIPCGVQTAPVDQLNGQASNSTKMKGEVIAYVEPTIKVPPHSYIPNVNELIVKVNKIKGNNAKFARVINEYFSEKTILPDNIFTEGGKWKFKVTRRVDCDGVLVLSAPLKKPDDDNKDKKFTVQDADQFILDPPPVVRLINSDEAKKIPSDQILPCYSILSFERN